MIAIIKTDELYKGVVRRAVYLGEVIEYAVEINGVPVFGIENDPHVTELFPVGEEVTIGFAEDCIQVLPAAKRL